MLVGPSRLVISVPIKSDEKYKLYLKSDENYKFTEKQLTGTSLLNFHGIIFLIFFFYRLIWIEYMYLVEIKQIISSIFICYNGHWKLVKLLSVIVIFPTSEELVHSLISFLGDFFLHMYNCKDFLFEGAIFKNLCLPHVFQTLDLSPLSLECLSEGKGIERNFHFQKPTCTNQISKKPMIPSEN